MTFDKALESHKQKMSEREIELLADEMLMAEGWVKTSNTPKGFVVKDRIFYVLEEKVYLVFDFKNKLVWNTKEDDTSVVFTFKDIVAIHQKLKELGWI